MFFINIKKLENGLTLITENFPHVKSVNISYFVGVGSYFEKNYPKGIAHFIEHMMFKGTNKRTAQEINEEIDFVGGMLNAYTTDKRTNYYCKVPSYEWKAGLDVISDFFWNATLPLEDIDKEKKVVIEEIKMYEDDPSDYASELLEKTLNEKIEERQSILGTIESVSSITKEDMNEFLNEFYVPNNTVIVVTGNIQEKQIEEYLNSITITRDFKNVEKPRNYINHTNQGKTISVSKDIQQAHLVWSYDGPLFETKDYFTTKVIVNLLGGSLSSRLCQIIREDKGLAYEVSVFGHHLDDCGFVQGYIGTEKEALAEIKEIIKTEFERLKNEKVPERELLKAKNCTKGNTIMSLETPAALNEFYGSRFLNNAILNPDEIIKKIDEVTAEDIIEVANKYFDKENIVFVEVVPKY